MNLRLVRTTLTAFIQLGVGTIGGNRDASHSRYFEPAGRRVGRVHGPEIIARTISARHAEDEFGNPWQYNPRSDHHSKVACWAILFDLLHHCAALAHDVEAGSAVFGINHEMRDFRTNRKKNLDLVLCTPRTNSPKKALTFKDLMDVYGVLLDQEELTLLYGLPDFRSAPVGAVRVALEAKAAMTAHNKAEPRLHDELDSSHATVHGAVENAVAVGLVMVNAAETFVSPGRNKHSLKREPAVVNRHQQPKAAKGVLRKVLEVRRRERLNEVGFDSLGAIVVDCKNDGSPVELVEQGYPEVASGQLLNYESMIHRVSQLYASRFPLT